MAENSEEKWLRILSPHSSYIGEADAEAREIVLTKIGFEKHIVETEFRIDNKRLQNIYVIAEEQGLLRSEQSWLQLFSQKMSSKLMGPRQLLASAGVASTLLGAALIYRESLQEFLNPSLEVSLASRKTEFSFQIASLTNPDLLSPLSSQGTLTRSVGPGQNNQRSKEGDTPLVFEVREIKAAGLIALSKDGANSSKEIALREIAQKIGITSIEAQSEIIFDAKLVTTFSGALSDSVIFVRVYDLDKPQNRPLKSSINVNSQRIFSWFVTGSE
jgi:hypothetical protein